jgi:WD40 repeat protein
MCLSSNGGGGVLASCQDSKITFWNWQTGEIIQTLQTTAKNILSFAFLKKPNLILTKHHDAYIYNLNKHFDQVFVWRVKF